LPPEIKRLVRSAIDTLLTKPTVGTALTGELVGYRSYRVRRYRIIYRINEDELASTFITSAIAGMFTKPCEPYCWTKSKIFGLSVRIPVPEISDIKND
jgi:hypothetical protein